MADGVPEMRLTFKAFDKMVPLSELKPSRYQRNKHPKEQIERLAYIMREHGVTHPIHVHREYGEICFGHGRAESFLLNGWTEAPIVYQDFASDEEYYAKVQSDNALAAWSELDLSAINTDLADLGPDFDLSLLGIESFMLDLSEINDLDEKPTDKDESLKHILEVQFSNEQEMIEVYNDLLSKGLIVRCK